MMKPVIPRAWQKGLYANFHIVIKTNLGNFRKFMTKSTSKPSDYTIEFDSARKNDDI